MWLLIVLFIGLVVGVVAKLLMPGPDPGGILVTSALGVGGALIAAFIGQAFGWYARGEPVGFIAAVLGAMLILYIYRLARRKRL